MGGKPGTCSVSEAKRRKSFKEKGVTNCIKGCHEVKKDVNRKMTIEVGMPIGGSLSLDGQGRWRPSQQHFGWSGEDKCQAGVGGDEDRRKRGTSRRQSICVSLKSFHQCVLDGKADFIAILGL